MVNKVILVGNVGIDPEVRTTESGVKVARVRLATTERLYDRQSNETKELTEWHTITLWRGLADVVDRYVRKGSQLYIEGRLRTREWVDKDNIKRYSTEILADEMKLLGRRSDNMQQGGAPQGMARVPRRVPRRSRVRRQLPRMFPQRRTIPTTCRSDGRCRGAGDKTKGAATSAAPFSLLCQPLFEWRIGLLRHDVVEETVDKPRGELLYEMCGTTLDLHKAQTLAVCYAAGDDAGDLLGRHHLLLLAGRCALLRSVGREG